MVLPDALDLGGRRQAASQKRKHRPLHFVSDPRLQGRSECRQWLGRILEEVIYNIIKGVTLITQACLASLLGVQGQRV